MQIGSKRRLILYIRLVFNVYSVSLSSLSKVSLLADCLINEPLDESQLEKEEKSLDAHLPGLIWTANDQCEMIYGPGATFCQVLIFF